MFIGNNSSWANDTYILALEGKLVVNGLDRVIMKLELISYWKLMKKKLLDSIKNVFLMKVLDGKTGY